MPELTITAVAREVGVRPSTLRYYEKIGLLPAARREAGRRRYDDYALNQVELITYAKRAGFTLAQIRALRENASLGKPPASFWHDLASTKAAELDQVIVRAQGRKSGSWRSCSAGAEASLNVANSCETQWKTLRMLLERVFHLAGSRQDVPKVSLGLQSGHSCGGL